MQSLKSIKEESLEKKVRNLLNEIAELCPDMDLPFEIVNLLFSSDELKAIHD